MSSSICTWSAIRSLCCAVDGDSSRSDHQCATAQNQNEEALRMLDTLSQMFPGVRSARSMCLILPCAVDDSHSPTCDGTEHARDRAEGHGTVREQGLPGRGEAVRGAASF